MGSRLVSILLTMTDGEANLGEQVGKHEAEEGSCIEAQE